MTFKATNLQVFFVNDLLDIRSFKGFDRAKTILELTSIGRYYFFDPDSIAEDVGDVRVLRPSDVAINEPGRWISRDRRLTVRTIVSNETLTDDDATIIASAHDALIIATLPSAKGRRGQVYTVLKIDDSVNPVVVAPAVGETINDLGSVSLIGKHDLLEVVSDNSIWSCR